MMAEQVRKSRRIRRNLGTTDRIIRVILGVILISLYNLEITAGVFGITLGVIGTIIMVTGFIGLCPAYYPFGIRTRKAVKEG